MSDVDLLAAGFKPAGPCILCEARDSLSLGLYAHIDRMKANDWSINLPPLPSGPFVGTPVAGNPFHPVVHSMKARPSALSVGNVVRLHNAVAFAMRCYGVVMNAHITIAWDMMGVRDHAQAMRLLTAFNHEAAKWLKVGSSADDDRRRITKRAMVASSAHLYVYVNENGRRKGFHTHELAFIPPVKAAAFEAWARNCLARLSGQRWIRPETIVIKVEKSGNEDRQVARCWSWFRYLTKQLHPDLKLRNDDGEWVAARTIFKPSHYFHDTPPIHCAQIASGSRNIWTKAQVLAGFRSRFHDTGELDRLYDGSELGERRMAIDTVRTETNMKAMLGTLNL